MAPMQATRTQTESLDPFEVFVYLAVEASVLKVDLEIYDGQGGPLIPEAEEESVGAYTVANLNDTDDDGTVDKDDGSVSGEVDLMKIVLKAEPDAGGDVTLTVPANVKLWKSSDKSSGEETSTTFAIGTLPKTLWAEVRQQSGALRDVDLELEYKGCTDKVKATAIWCNTPNIRTTQDASYTAVNSVRPSAWVPDMPDLLGLQKTGIEDGDTFAASMECVYSVQPIVHISALEWRCRQYAKRNFWINGTVQPGFPDTDWVLDSNSAWSDREQDPDVYACDSPRFTVQSPNTSYSMKANFKVYLETRIHSGGSWSRCSPLGFWNFGRRAYYYGPNEWKEWPAGANFIGSGQISGEPSTWTEN